ncbi:MAG: glutathione S-transferase family protein [Gammaproteobacteria bacterium]
MVNSPSPDAKRWRRDYAIEGIEALQLHHLYLAMGWLGEPLPEKEQGVDHRRLCSGDPRRASSDRRQPAVSPAEARGAAPGISLRNGCRSFLDYFERVLAAISTGRSYMLGALCPYVDLSIFQLIAGLRYAFPKKMKRLEH